MFQINVSKQEEKKGISCLAFEFKWPLTDFFEFLNFIKYKPKKGEKFVQVV